MDYYLAKRKKKEVGEREGRGEKEKERKDISLRLCGSRVFPPTPPPTLWCPSASPHSWGKATPSCGKGSL